MEIKRCYDTLIGASVRENQLVQSGATSATVPNGHKYYSKINGTETLGASTGTAIAINDSAKDMVTDLTLKLGSAIADYVYGLGASSGIAKLRSWGFLRGYQAFNAGSIESVEVTGKKVVGFNQWDEVWEEGGISDTTGQNAEGGYRIRSKNYIPVIPGGSYYYRESAGYFIYMRYYDANKNFVKASSGHITNTIDVIPGNVRFVRFMVYKNGWTDYANHGDICINISSDRNGQYEPYSAHIYDLGTDTLRGLFKLDSENRLYADGDTKTSDGVITRKYGVVDLGTLNWTYITSSTAPQFRAALSNTITSTSATTTYNAICAKYPILAHYTMNDGNHDKSASIFYASLPGINITDSSYSDAATFKAAMSGVMLVYELATPTTEQSTPFTSPQVCYPDGTEEFVTENHVPVGHETEYQL